jgi:hypothetical protein
MRQIVYAMQFRGQGGPTDQENVLQAATSSPSSRIVSKVSAAGVESQVDAVDGATAQFESEVRLTGGTSFTETGKITFGAGNSFSFSTIGEGYLADSPQEGLSHGSVMWRIDEGEGQFAGASGIITSNFTFGSTGEVTDNHFGLIWLR